MSFFKNNTGNFEIDVIKNRTSMITLFIRFFLILIFSVVSFFYGWEKVLIVGGVVLAAVGIVAAIYYFGIVLENSINRGK